MINSLLALFVISFIVRTVRQVLFQTYLWQLKEYRLDRFWSYLKTETGKNLLFSKVSLFKWFLIFLIYSFPVPVVIYAFYLFWVVWSLEFIFAVRDIFLLRWRIPVITVKSVLIIITVLTVQFSPIITINWLSPLLLAPFLDKFLAPFLALTVLFMNVPSMAAKKVISFLAKNKIRRLKNIKVIAITGSFGKTSTKYFLSKILSSKYHISLTPESYNTEIAIARHIIRDLKDTDDYFIVEIGAYKRGEIDKICRLVKPDIAIITGIGSQHLELFGSEKNLVEAKFELIENISHNGRVIINSSNSYLKALIHKKGIISSKFLEINKRNLIKNLIMGKTNLQFDLKVNSRHVRFQANLLGSSNVDNLITAILTSKSLGLPIPLIRKQVGKITSPEKTMQLVKSSNNLVLIDDTFNANFEGVIASLDYLKLYRGLRVLFLNPLIELGNAGSSFHRLIGQKAGLVCHYLIVTNKNSYSDLQTGIDKSDRKLTKLLLAESNVVNLILRQIKPDSVILFTGKESKRWIPFF